MAKFSRVAGTTSQSINIFIQNSSLTTGLGLTGLVFNTSGLIAYYTFTGANCGSTVISLATLATVGAAWSSGGFKEIDSTNMAGLYRLDIPNAVLAASKGNIVTVQLGGAANMAPVLLEIELTGWDNQDAVHGGMSALPNTACTSNASLLTSGTGAAQIQVDGAGNAYANVNKWLTGTIPAPNVTGVPKVDLVDILGTAVSTPATAGILDVNVKNMNNVAATSITTINANQGTTQPLNFTGTGASAYVQVDLKTILGTASAGAAGYVGVDWSKVTNPTSTVGLTGTTVGTVTTVTNQLTAAAIATGVWQDTTSGDFTVSGSIGKSLFTSGNAPGAASGIALVGSNMGTVSSVTGNIGGNVNGSVGSISGITFPTNFFAMLISSGGNVGIDWSQVSNPTSTVNLSGTTVKANVTAWDGTNVTSTVPPDAIFIRSGTAQAGGASTITLDSGASATNNLYQNATLFIRGGTGAGQTNQIVSYVGSTKVATMLNAWATNPDNTSTFSIIPPGPVSASVSGTVNANVTEWGGSAVATPNVSGVPIVDIGYTLGTASAGTAGYIGIDWSAIHAPTSTVGLTNTTIHAVSGISGVTFPTNFSALSINSSGYVTLASSGLDQVVVETGLNIRQAIALDTAALCGVLSGAATTTITILGAGVATTRVVATCDSSGDRSALTLTPPA